MKKLLTSVLGLLSVTAAGLPAQAEEQAPRLVIGIHVDQLDDRCLEWLAEGYGEDGLRKVLQGGTRLTDMVYASARPDRAAAAAAFATGTVPRFNGIPGSRWYDRATGKDVSCILDSRYIGNYTLATVSPARLTGSTLGDELKKASNGQARVISVGIDAEEAVLLAGHAADGAFWMDEVTGKWCTSTWYGDMPTWLQGINDTEDRAEWAGKAEWTPIWPLDHYRYMPYQAPPELFRKKFDRNGENRLRLFKQSPLMNDEVTRVALRAIEREPLGRDEATDYLVLQLSAKPAFDGERLTPVELQDIYYRLDRNIADLLKATERWVGNNRVVLYLTGLGTADEPAVEQPSDKAYTGDFHPDRCTSLLNLYLMALYGNDQWVSAWDRQAIYLNRKRIDEKGLSLPEVTRKAADFLAEFSGVSRVYTLQELLHGANVPELAAQANAVDPKTAADLYLDILGGWNVRELSTDLDYLAGSAFFSTPFVLYRPDRKGQVVEHPVQAGDVTASLSRIFRIRPPTSCAGRPLPELR